MYELPRGETAARCDELLRRLELTGRRNDKLGSLSSGLKKRAQLARALLLGGAGWWIITTLR